MSESRLFDWLRNVATAAVRAKPSILGKKELNTRTLIEEVGLGGVAGPQTKVRHGAGLLADETEIASK